MLGNFKISHVVQNILPLTKSQGYSGDEIKSKKGERRERKKGTTSSVRPSTGTKFQCFWIRYPVVKGGGGGGGGEQRRERATNSSHIHSFLYKNVVFPAQAKNYYFILLLG